MLFTERIIVGMGGTGDTYSAAVEMERRWSQSAHFELYDDALPVLDALREPRAEDRAALELVARPGRVRRAPRHLGRRGADLARARQDQAAPHDLPRHARAPGGRAGRRGDGRRHDRGRRRGRARGGHAGGAARPRGAVPGVRRPARRSAGAACGARTSSANRCYTGPPGGRRGCRLVPLCGSSPFSTSLLSPSRSASEGSSSGTSLINGWPIHHANVWLVVLTGFIFLAAYGFKAWGWQRLFRASAGRRWSRSPLPVARPRSAGSRCRAASTSCCRIAVVRRCRVRARPSARCLLALPARPDRQLPRWCRWRRSPPASSTCQASDGPR